METTNSFLNSSNAHRKPSGDIMSFFWVNIGTSYKEVKQYEFLWAPAYTIKKNGKKTVDAGWKNVPRVKKGDVIFCHENGKITHVAVAKTNAYSSERPPNRTYKEWKSEGFKIDIDLTTLDTPVDTENFKETLILLYNEHCEPKLFNIKKQATQNYMIAIPDAAGALILDSTGMCSITIQDKVNDVKGNKKPKKTTVREAIIRSRVGQGKFRDDVLELWGNTCPVTGVDLPEFIIASHIFPWQLSDDNEKLDKFNGLPLSPSIDKLFDKGYVSFSNKGEILISKKVATKTIKLLGIDPNTKIKGLHKDNFYYLEKHRQLFGFQIK